MSMELSNGLPTGTIKDRNGQIVGFGMLRPHHPLQTFSRTAEATSFLHPDETYLSPLPFFLNFPGV